MKYFKHVIYILLAMGVHLSISGQTITESPYAIFGDSTPTLCESYTSKDTILLIVPCGEVDLQIYIKENTLFVKNDSGEILYAEAIEPTMRALFNRPDPKSWDYPGINPFLYCAANPILNIDPSGEDIYTVDESGNIILQNVTEDDFDTLIASSTMNSINIDKGILNNLFSEKLPDNNGTVNINIMTLDGHTSDLHEFLSQNTNVEWSSIQYVDDNNTLKTQIGTSHLDGMDYSMSYIVDMITTENGSVMTAMHNHPNKSTIVSNGDVKVANMIIQNHPFAEFYILVANPTIRKIEYSPQSTPGLINEVTVIGTRPNKR